MPEIIGGFSQNLESRKWGERPQNKDQKRRNITEGEIPKADKPVFKEEFLGVSKIERGLNNFRIYRIAENSDLLRLRPRHLKKEERNGWVRL